MNKLLTIVSGAFLFSGCLGPTEKIMLANEEGITISVNEALRVDLQSGSLENASKIASEHCAKYSKSPVMTGTSGGNGHSIANEFGSHSGAPLYTFECR